MNAGLVQHCAGKRMLLHFFLLFFLAIGDGLRLPLDMGLRAMCLHVRETLQIH